ncbi:MAG TPA: peptidoglycan DD-metalloendopeptidase family protein [Caulobacteraceae bacterium]|nr:peptidoglycan DD-metalloendopeptidase family protein [Caulobacteraceae bacterium]
MSLRRFARLALWLEELFPERHLYLRSGGEMRGYVLTTERQLLLAGLVAFGALWMGVTTAATLVSVFTPSKGDQEVARTEARYERWIADRDARLSSAVAQLNASGGSFQDLADSVEKRHAALALLLTDLKGAPGAADALMPALAVSTPAQASPAQRIRYVEQDQDRLIDAAETFAKSRADRLKLAFRLAGLDPAAYAGDGGLGGPLIDGKDPRALAAVLDVDEDFAGRLQHAVADLSEMQSLSSSEAAIPLAQPTGPDVRETSGFGARSDPFSGEPAYHPGQDFAGAYGSPIYVTAPGVVAFAGVRNGYGNTVEVDHGHGFKTRYGHLSAISVSVGQQVAVGQRIGAMGSTGRSTGTHLHYETWLNGRPVNPLRFIKAGEYVQQTRF